MKRRLNLLVLTGALMVALAATVASAQAYEAEEIEVTGVLEEGSLPYGPAGFPYFFINDEETGTERPLLECGRGAVNNLEDFVGQRVTVSGIPQTQGEPPSSFPNPNEIPLCVTVIEFAGDSSEGSARGEDIFGTAQSEAIYGTNAADNLDGRGGHDLLVGQGGADEILGGPGNDYLVAAYGYWQVAPDAPASRDTIYGGAGDDLIDAADLAGAPDYVECGPGSDLVYDGVEDYVAADCEFVYRYYGF